MIATRLVIHAVREMDGTVPLWFGAPEVEVERRGDMVRLRLSEEMAGRAQLLDVGLRHADARRLAARLLEETEG